MIAIQRNQAARHCSRIAMRKHLEALGGGEFTFQTFDDSGKGRPGLVRVLHGTGDQHFDELKQLNDLGAGIYITVNETDGKGRRTPNVRRVRAHFLDLDGAPLDPVLKWSLRPRIAIESSPGKFHSYILAKRIKLGDFRRTQKRLITLFGGDPKIHDLPRVLRLAGFWHLKDAANPFRVRIVHDDPTAPRYQQKDFDAALTDVLESKTENESAQDQIPVVDPDTAANIEWAIHYLKNDAPMSVEGQGGEATLLQVAGTLKDHGISEHMAIELIAEHYNVFPTCDPLWNRGGAPADDLEVKVHNAYSYLKAKAPGADTAEAEFANEPDGLPAVSPAEMAARKVKTEARRKLKEQAPAPETWKSLRDGWVYVGQQKRFVRLRDAMLWDKQAFADYFANVEAPDKQRGGNIATFILTRKPGEALPRFDTFVYKPGRPQRVGGALNLYVPSDIEAKQGDTKLWDSHLEYLYPEKADRDLVLNWLAWVLQHLDKKPKHALVLHGEIQGTGKSFIADVMDRLVGLQNSTPVDQTTLELPHNGWALHTKLIVCEEVRASGGTGRDGISKKLHRGITQTRCSVDEKGMPPVTIDDVMAYFLMTNKIDSIPMDDSDRRYLIVTTHAKRNTDEYYVRLFDTILDGPGAPERLAAIKWQLENRKLGGYTAAGPAPYTAAKGDMIAAAADEVEQWMIEHDGAPPLCWRVVTPDEVIEHIPRRLHTRRTGTIVRDVLHRKFNGRHYPTQIRPGGRSGEKIHVWLIGDTWGDGGKPGDVLKAYRIERASAKQAAAAHEAHDFDGAKLDPWE